MNNINTHAPQQVCYKATIITMVAVIITTISIILWSLLPITSYPVADRTHSWKDNKFKLQYKTVYAFNKFLGSVDSNVKLRYIQETSRNATIKSSDYKVQSLRKRCYTREDSAGCPCSEVPGHGSFFCSKVHSSTDNIFFLETSCASDKRRGAAAYPLTEKQACSIYSAALHNPSRKVIVILTCPIPDGFNLIEEWKPLFALPNFHFSRVDIAKFYASTSLSAFYRGKLAQASFPVEHHADLFRLVVLYFYGGTYMDLDVISLRPLNDLGVNFVGYDGSAHVGNAVMNFEPGHGLIKSCLANAILDYQPESWNSIGPILLTSTLERFCNVNISKDLDPKSVTHLSACNVTVLPNSTFFAVRHEEWLHFYNESFWPKIKKLLNGSYAVHYWNHMGSHQLTVGSHQPIIQLAKQHCPALYENSGSVLD